MLRRTVLLSLPLAASISVDSRAAYPEEQVTLVVPFLQKGFADILARQLAVPLAKSLGRSVGVVNVPGDAGTSGSTDVAQAVPNGYRLLLSSGSSMSTGPAIFDVGRAPYDSITSFTHVALIGIVPMAIVCSANRGPATLAGWISERNTSSSRSIGYSGVGTMNQMAADLVVKEMAAEFVSAPFDTIGALIDSVSYGEVSLAIGPVGVFARAVKDGRLRILAVASRTRSPIAPDAPTLPELGFQSLVLEDYWGVSGPAKLPANVVATLTAGISDTVANSNVVAALHRLGVTPNFLDGESFASYVLEHRSIWSRAARPTPAR